MFWLAIWVRTTQKARGRAGQSGPDILYPYLEYCQKRRVLSSVAEYLGQGRIACAMIT
jgi:hypothetical protein